MSTPPDAPRDPQQGPPPPGYPPPGSPPPGYPAPAYPQPAYPQPGYPPGYPQPGQPPGYGQFPAYPKPAKRRPSAWWFVPGAVALVVALACGVYGGFTIADLFHTDGYVRAGGGAQTVVLDGAGEHMLFGLADTARPTCSVTESGTPLPLDRVSETETVDVSTGSWVPFASFTSDGSQVEVSCDLTAGSVRVGAPAGEGEYIRIGISIIAAAVLGLGGLVVTILVGVLFLTRPSRKVTG